MRLPRSKVLCLALALRITLTSGAPAWAQEGGGEGEFGLGVGVGVGGIIAESPYGFTSYGAVPMIDFDSTYFKVSGPSVDLKLPWISSDELSFALRASYGAGEGYDADDADILTGMADRESGWVWAGPAVEWHTDIADVSFEGLAEIGGDSSGYRMQLGVSRMFMLSDQIMLGPRGGMTFMDENAVDYFYGVRPEEAMASRPAYQGSATINFDVGVSAAFVPWENHMLMLDLGVTSLGEGITDSPIVVDDTLGAIFLGYTIKF